MVIQSEKWLFKYRIGSSNQSWLFKIILVVQNNNGCSKQISLFKLKLVVQNKCGYLKQMWLFKTRFGYSMTHLSGKGVFKLFKSENGF